MEDTLVDDYQFAHNIILLASKASRPESKNCTSWIVSAPPRGLSNKVNLQLRCYLRPILPQNSKLLFKHCTFFIWCLIQSSKVSKFKVDFRRAQAKSAEFQNNSPTHLCVGQSIKNHTDSEFSQNFEELGYLITKDNPPIHRY